MMITFEEDCSAVNPCQMDSFQHEMDPFSNERQRGREVDFVNQEYGGIG